MLAGRNQDTVRADRDRHRGARWLLAPIASACAAGQGRHPLIRDTEVEQLLRDYTRPILRAAGLEQQNIQIVIINERALQRLRRGRPPHFRQLRRADAIADAEPD